MKELKIVVRINSQGDDFTVFSIIVGGMFISPTNDSFVCNSDIAQFLHRLQPDLIQWQDRVTNQTRAQIESHIASLRESPPDVQKINGELLHRANTVCQCFENLGMRAIDQWQQRDDAALTECRTAIRNAKEAQ